MTDNRLNYKLVIASVATMLVLHSLIAHFWERESPISASLWGNNSIRTERFLYESDNTECVIVGSSMSALLDLKIPSSTPDQPDILNLAYASGSPTTGMELIVQSDLSPTCLLIEANLAYKEIDKDQLALLQNKFLFTLKGNIRSLWHENQPMNLLLTFIKTLRNQFQSPSDQNSINRPLQKRSEASLAKMAPLVKSRIDTITQIPEEMIIDGIHNMIELAAQLEARGTRIIFFEIPGEALERESIYYQRLRTNFSKQFADARQLSKTAAKLHVLEIEVSETTDGVHLNQQSVALTTEALIALVNRQQ